MTATDPAAQPQPTDQPCRNCGRPIRWSPGAGEPYWYHPADAFSTIWCDGWGDPEGTFRQAAPNRDSP
jgi:hypothetical protein